MNTLKTRILSCVPALWKKWFIKHIKVTEDNNLPSFAGVRLKDNQLEMFVNSDLINNISNSDLYKLIIHEVAHIIRGDILTPKTYNMELANIAQDAIINSNLKIESIGGVSGFTIKVLQESYPDKISDNPLSWVDIYNVLKKEYDKSLNKLKQQLFDLVMEFEGNEENNKDVLDEVILDLIEDDPEVINKIGFQSSVGSTKISIKLTTSQILEKIIREIETFTGNRIKTRTYRRENPISENLKGISRIPINNVLVVADVSGSYVSYTETIIGLFYWMNQMNIVSKFATFSDDYAIYDNISSINDIKGYGGCTYIKSLFNYLVKNPYDLVIIFTDGDIFDWKQELRNTYKGKIIWVLDDSSSFNAYNQGDVILLNDKVFNK